MKARLRLLFLLSVSSASSAVIAVAFARCSTNDASPTSPSPLNDAGVSTVVVGSATQTIAPTGGTVTLGAVSLVVPAGALGQSTTIGITAKTLQEGGGTPSTVYEFSPNGLAFSTAATINIPGTSGLIYWSTVIDGVSYLAQLPTTFSNGVASASVTHFSLGFLGAGSGNGTGAIDSCAVTNLVTGKTALCPTGYAAQTPLTYDEGSNVPLCEALLYLGTDAWGGTIPSSFEMGGPPVLCFPAANTSPSGAPDAATLPSGGTSSLTGTWDVIGGATGASQTGTLVMSSTQFSLALSGGDILSYSVNGGVMTGSWTTDDEGTKTFPVARTPTATPVSYGVVPLAMDGAWTFGATGSGQLSLNLSSGAIATSVNQYLGFPYPVPEPQPGISYTATRTQTATSIFGDLGGTWMATSTAHTGGCTVSFTGNTFTSNCDESAEKLAGSCTLTFAASLDTASGSSMGSVTSETVELSAHRR